MNNQAACTWGRTTKSTWYTSWQWEYNCLYGFIEMFYVSIISNVYVLWGIGVIFL